ncbi:MAG: hypothetical protein ACI8X5_003176 [Planctomycetota bacterium]|jgi:hypothetical protein
MRRQSGGIPNKTVPLRLSGTPPYKFLDSRVHFTLNDSMRELDGKTSEKEKSKSAPTKPISLADVRTRLAGWSETSTPAFERLCIDVMRDAGFFLSQEDLLEQSLVRIALQPEVTDYSTEWLEERITEAMIDQLHIDRERLEVGDTGSTETNSRDRLLVLGIGVRADRVLASAVAYNALPMRVRHAFYGVAMDNHELDELIGTEWADLDELSEDIHLALEALLGMKRSDVYEK